MSDKKILSHKVSRQKLFYERNKNKKLRGGGGVKLTPPPEFDRVKDAPIITSP